MGKEVGRKVGREVRRDVGSEMGRVLIECNSHIIEENIMSYSE